MKLAAFGRTVVPLALAACLAAGTATAQPARDADRLKIATALADSTMKRSPEAWAMRPNKGLKEPTWGYTYGLALMAFQRLSERTGDERYLTYGKTYADQLIDTNGRIRDYQVSDFNVDSVNAGKILFVLHSKYGDPRYLKAMQALRSQLDWHPRTRTGGLWHKLIYPWQMWLDGLYMGAAYWAQYAATFHDQAATFDDIAHQFTLIEEKTRDPKTGLLYHGWDESRLQAWADPRTGLSPSFWSRAMGWYAMALVDVLEFMPEDHKDRPKLIAILRRLAPALAAVQHESGLWYQVTDQGDRAGNYLEASGSAMFSYAIARAVNRGYVDARFRSVAERAFDGLATRLIKVDPRSGEVHLTGICGSGGLGGTPYRSGTFEYYIGEPQQDDDPHGVGPFILAAVELTRR